ncbi:putative lipoprotein [Minicystis rosea]|nr:putative lipoprotein [Minicystis rosea]
MKAARFEVLIGIIIAGASLGARGLSCGPCGGDSTTIIPVLPPNNDGGADADAGDFLTDACERMCNGADDCVHTTIETSGGVIPAIECTHRVDCGAGRRPVGLLAPSRPRGSATAVWLAQMAHLEAASVDAFRMLRRDLASHRAPRRLLQAASRAARDERRHARRMTALARRRGAHVEAPRAEPSTPPTLEALAMHNAVEGCVREAYGAVVARFQASAAADRDIAIALARIAAEEARHASLAFQIDAWARSRLSPAARARVDRARTEAAQALLVEVACPVPEALVRHAGHPDRATAERLAQTMIAVLGLLPS